jgi:hypothetical protein
MSKMIATAGEVSLDDCASYLLALANSYGRVLEPIREVSIHDEELATSRFSMMRIMAR